MGVFLLGVPSTLGEHMVSCASLLEPRTATSQVTFQNFWVFISRLHPSAQEKVNSAKAELEVCCCFIEQAFSCPRKCVNVLLVCPEDLGGDVVDGFTSIWESHEVRTLDGADDVQRGASFLCSLTGADQSRPLGFLANLLSLQIEDFQRLAFPPPDLQRSTLRLAAPALLPMLPSAILPLRGLDSRKEFHSSSSSGPVESFVHDRNATFLRGRGSYRSVFLALALLLLLLDFFYSKCTKGFI